MAIYYDFKEKLAFDFGRVLGKRVEPEDLVIGAREALPTGSAFDSLVEITALGVTRKIAYSRSDIALLISSMTQTELIIDLPEGTSRLYDALDYVNMRFGTRFTADDVLDVELSPGTYPVWLTAKPTSQFYIGRAQLVFKQAGIPSKIRPAIHVFDLQGNTADTGTEPVDMGVPFNYREIEGKTFAFLKQVSGHVPFDPKLRMRVCGDFTLDMELTIDNPAYGYLYMMVQNAQGNGGSNSYGQLAFYGNKFYQYGYTGTQSAAFSRMPVIPANKPTRLTLRSAFGVVNCFINGEYIMDWPIPAASAGIELLGFRNIDSGASQWPVGCGLRKISYWDSGLSNNELDLLFGKAIPKNRPLLHYPLEKDGRNIGESSVSWPEVNLTFVEVMKRKMARCASHGGAIGSAMNFNREFTLQFDYYCPTVSGGYEGIFGDSTGATVNGALKMVYGLLYLHGGQTAFTTTDMIQRGQYVTITIMRTKDGLTHLWCDHKYMGYTILPANCPLITNFGKAGETLNITTNHFADLKFWERSFNMEELKEIISPKAQILTVCPGGTELSGATVIFDNNLGTYWNVTNDPTVTGKIPAEMVGKYIHNFRIHFATDSINFKKKIRNINIDFKNESGNWVTYCSMSTQFCRNASPDHETIVPIVPFIVPSRDIRIRCTGNYGDEFGYRWCTEIVLNYGDLKEEQHGGKHQPPAPLHHWPLNGKPINKGTNGTPLTAVFDYVEYGDTLWASHATPKLQALGVSLPCNTAFTLQFRIVSKVNTGVDLWQGIFNDSTGSEAGPVVKISCNDSPVKDWFPYMPGTWVFNRLVAKAYKPGSENIVTIRGLNGTVFIWLNGVLILITTAPAGFTAWTHIGKAGQFMEKNTLIRDIRYWDTFLSDLELDYLFRATIDEPKPPLPPPPPPTFNPYPEVRMPKVGWGFDDENIFASVGSLTAAADLSGGEFEVVTFGGEKYFSPKTNSGLLPAEINVANDFTLDFEIVASPYTTGDPYGVVLSNIRNTDPSAHSAIVGTLMTWRNIAGVENAPVLLSMGYGSPGESLFRPGFGEFKTRFTLRRSGNVFTWWRNGVRVWTFSNVTKPVAWKYFGSAIKRALHLGRKFAYWDVALEDADMSTLFASPDGIRKPKLHYTFSGGALTSNGTDPTPISLPIASTSLFGKDTLIKLSKTNDIDLGVNLPIATDFTLMFKVRMSDLPKYNTLFSTNRTAQAGAGTVMFNYGKIYQAGVGYSPDIVPPALKVGILHEITLRSISGVLEIYIDGVKVHSYNNPGTHMPYRYLGDGNTFSSQWPTTNELGRIAYWDSALSDLELSAAFRGDPLV